MASLLSLPNEILCHIADYSTGKDLSKMRLASKQLYDAAKRPFAMIYFTERHHVLSKTSIRALVKIVTHPVFGPYVKAITLTAMWPVDGSSALETPYHLRYSQDFRPPGMAFEKAFINSRVCKDLLRQVFKAINENQESIRIKISGETGGFGWRGMVNNPPRAYNACYTETLDHTLKAAIKAACPVRSLELWMHHYDFQTLNKSLQGYIGSNQAPLRLVIHCDRKRTRALQTPYTCYYNQDLGALKLVGCSLDELSRARPGSTIKSTLAFLLALNCSQLTLENCRIHNPSTLQHLLSLGAESLKKITIRHLHTVSTEVRHRRLTYHHREEQWTVVLRSLSQQTSLKHVLLEFLSDSYDRTLFALVGGTGKCEIKGDDTSNQLENLADLVASAPQLEILLPGQMI
jgi:hypothetical protein